MEDYGQRAQRGVNAAERNPALPEAVDEHARGSSAVVLEHGHAGAILTLNDVTWRRSVQTRPEQIALRKHEQRDAD